MIQHCSHFCNLTDRYDFGTVPRRTPRNLFAWSDHCIFPFDTAGSLTGHLGLGADLHRNWHMPSCPQQCKIQQSSRLCKLTGRLGLGTDLHHNWSMQSCRQQCKIQRSSHPCTKQRVLYFDLDRTQQRNPRMSWILKQKISQQHSFCSYSMLHHCLGWSCQSDTHHNMPETLNYCLNFRIYLLRK